MLPRLSQATQQSQPKLEKQFLLKNLEGKFIIIVKMLKLNVVKNGMVQQWLQHLARSGDRPGQQPRSKASKRISAKTRNHLRWGPSMDTTKSHDTGGEQAFLSLDQNPQKCSKQRNPQLHIEILFLCLLDEPCPHPQVLSLGPMLRKSALKRHSPRMRTAECQPAHHNEVAPSGPWRQVTSGIDGPMGAVTLGPHIARSCRSP